ncbi:quinone oxidoreductase-like protein 1 isoform X2 [Homalodisca vitripennis]|uniref:quinone oxidoreductase-like protein 1 isoform X2 n=1 Tax=Homalodisca vitripennis TaxID=197043 RepID=UPI001EEB7480|nr:quinone oxidoreductase-like protein 1 isoform X2 [Homalodisca vitripennis]
MNMKTRHGVFLEYDGSSATPNFVLSKEENLPELGKYGILVEIKACGLSVPLGDGASLTTLIRKMGCNRLPAGQDIAGVVRAIGSDVSSLRVGDQVTGVIPIDSEQSGCAERVVLQEFDVVMKPNSVSFVDAAGCVGECVRSYLALYYLGRLVSGDTVLVLNGATALGSACVQLAHHWGARVIATCSSSDEKLYLQTLSDKLVHVVDMENKSTLRAACLKETADLGVDLIIDLRSPYSSQSNKNYGELDSNLSKDDEAMMPSNHELVSCLAVGARWVTVNCNLQLDPPISRQMSLRCANLGFLFDQAWFLSSTHQGKYQHILMDIVEKLSTYTIRPNIHHTVTVDGILEAWQDLHEVVVVSETTESWVVAEASTDVSYASINYGLYKGTLLLSDGTVAEDKTILTMTCLLYLNICALSCQDRDSLRRDEVLTLYNAGRVNYTCNYIHQQFVHQVSSKVLKTKTLEEVRGSFIDGVVWLATIICVVLSGLISLVTLALTAYNINHVPSNSWVSIHGLYFWFGASSAKQQWWLCKLYVCLCCTIARSCLTLGPSLFAQWRFHQTLLLYHMLSLN